MTPIRARGWLGSMGWIVGNLYRNPNLEGYAGAMAAGTDAAAALPHVRLHHIDTILSSW